MEVKHMPKEEESKGSYEVLTTNCVWGSKGDVIELTLTRGQETALLRAGTLKVAPPVRPTPAADKKGR